MADKKLKALERLVGKLSAVRKTLRGEERRLLDQMVLSLTTEVSPHASRADKSNATAAAKGKQMRNASGEVALHGAKLEKQTATGAAQASVSKPVMRNSAAKPLMRNTAAAPDSEVNIHSMHVDKASASGAIATSATSAAQARISLSNNAYKVAVE